ncbi:hypothetical protein [Sphingopyxis sp.]|uniref:hypothetical protein n=1 Tax=Sphingopyxis sp. TaxID=1908224 RepID=UPI0035B464C2
MLDHLFVAPLHTHEGVHLGRVGFEKLVREIAVHAGMIDHLRCPQLRERANGSVMGDVGLDEKLRLRLILRGHAFDKGERRVVFPFVAGSDRFQILDDVGGPRIHGVDVGRAERIHELQSRQDYG